MSKNMMEATIVTASRPHSRSMLTASALLLLATGYAIQQNPIYRNFVEGFSVSRMVDAARAPREKAGIIREVTPAIPVETAAQVDARIIQGFVEMQAERDAEARALAANPVHSSDPFATLPRSVTARYENVVGGDGVSRRRVVGEFRLPARPRRVEVTTVSTAPLEGAQVDLLGERGE
ncbi:hypothetical protein K2P56_02435 [Patescibacteria group bacterium]|nr:hypothetical protein [Patescibacteria group bacterium]